MDTEWTTRLSYQELIRRFGVEEKFMTLPSSRMVAGTRAVRHARCPRNVSCSLSSPNRAGTGLPLVIVNRPPPTDRNVKHWIRVACERATKERAFLVFSCDTREQAERVARRAAKLLRHHKRAALERVRDPRVPGPSPVELRWPEPSRRLRALSNRRGGGGKIFGLPMRRPPCLSRAELSFQVECLTYGEFVGNDGYGVFVYGAYS